MDGRYGAYVTDGTTNATIPKTIEKDALTLEEAAQLIDERAAKGPTKGKNKLAAKKKPAAKKAPAKKAPAKKAPAKKAKVKDRKSVVSGQRESVSVNLGGSRKSKKKN